MKIKFQAEVEVPDGTPIDDVEKWLRFELGETGELSVSNAMAHTDLISSGCRHVEIRQY